MKKFLGKVVSIIAVITIILINQMCYATQTTPLNNSTNEVSTSNVTNVTNEINTNINTNIVEDATALQNETYQNDIMLINQMDNMDPVVELDDNEEYNDDEYLDDESEISSDIYECKDKVLIDKDVDGNIYVFANECKISSVVYGNVFIMAKNIKIDGSIEGSAYIMAENIEITSEVYSMYAVCSSLKLAEESTIGSDLRAIVSDDLNINGGVYRDVYAQAKKVYIDENAYILGKGEIEYTDTIENNCEDISEIEIKKSESNAENNEKEDNNKFDIAMFVYKVLSALIIICIIYLLTKGSKVKDENNDKDVNAIVTFLIGFASIFVIPLLCIVLFFTIIGISVSLILFALYIIGLCISLSLASLKISKMLLESKENANSLIIILVATLVYAIIQLFPLVPIVGIIAKNVISIWGLGLILVYIFNKKVQKQQVDSIVIKGDIQK